MTKPEYIITALVAAGHVSQDVVDKAGELYDLCQPKDWASATVSIPPEPLTQQETAPKPIIDHKLSFPEILRPYLRIDMGRTCYEARTKGVSMRHLANVLGVTNQAISYVQNYYRITHGLTKCPRYQGSAKDFQIYYEINKTHACYALRSKGMEWRAIREVAGCLANPASGAYQYAKNHNLPWPITTFSK